MTEPPCNVEGLFDEDYLHFYAERTGLARSAAEVELVWRLLELEPGTEVLDLACGHGRIANRLAERGCRVSGLDATPRFLNRAQHDAHARAVTVDYVLGDMRRLPRAGRFDRVINWFTLVRLLPRSGQPTGGGRVCPCPSTWWSTRTRADALFLAAASLPAGHGDRTG